MPYLIWKLGQQTISKISIPKAASSGSSRLKSFFLKQKPVCRTHELDAPTVFDKFPASLSKLQILFWVSVYHQQPICAVLADFNKELQQTYGFLDNSIKMI